MKNILTILAILLFFNVVNGQTIELKEVHVICNKIQKNDSIQYVPYEMHFTFYAKNTTNNKLKIGANNFPFSEKKKKYGFFSFATDYNTKLELNSRYDIICLSPKDSIKLIGEFYNKDYFSNIYSYKDIYESIIKNKIIYNAIEKDYSKCSGFFQSMEIEKKDFLVFFTYDGETIFFNSYNLK